MNNQRKQGGFTRDIGTQPFYLNPAFLGWLLCSHNKVQPIFTIFCFGTLLMSMTTTVPEGNVPKPVSAIAAAIVQGKPIAGKKYWTILVILAQASKWAKTLAKIRFGNPFKYAEPQGEI